MRCAHLSSLAVLLFFSLQLLSVGADALPQGAGTFPHALQSLFAPLTVPYAALTAQWQRWDLFAPEPLSEVVTLAIDAKGGNGLWEEVVVIGSGVWKWPADCSREDVTESVHLRPALRGLWWTTSCGGWWRETALLKVARALAEEDPRYDRSRRTFLQRFCEFHAFPRDTALRLRVRSYDMLQPAVITETIRIEHSCTDTELAAELIRRLTLR